MARQRILGIGLVVLLLGAGSVAICAEPLAKSAAPLDATKAREAECSLGDLVADATASAMGAKVALVQASQLRQVTIPAGDISGEKLTSALLYPDERVVLAELTGAQLTAALERGLSMLPKPNTAFLQVSGITVSFRSDAPEGHRVLAIRVGGSPVVTDQRYGVAMPASLAKGALGYFRVFNGLEPKETGPVLGDALVSYVAARKTIGPAGGRLQDLASAGAQR